MQQSLQAKGLMISCPISTGRARIKILSLTDLGKRVLGVDEPDSDRLGGPEHRYWRRRLAEHLSADGYQVMEEAPLGGGRTADLLAVKDGRRIAVEVETGKSDAAGNVRKCLAAGMNCVVVLATSRTAHDNLARVLSPTPRVKLVNAASPRGWSRRDSTGRP